MNSVPTMLAAVPVNRATNNCQAALSFEKLPNQRYMRSEDDLILTVLCDDL